MLYKIDNKLKCFAIAFGLIAYSRGTNTHELIGGKVDLLSMHEVGNKASVFEFDASERILCLRFNLDFSDSRHGDALETSQDENYTVTDNLLNVEIALLPTDSQNEPKDITPYLTGQLNNKKACIQSETDISSCDKPYGFNDLKEFIKFYNSVKSASQFNVLNTDIYFFMDCSQISPEYKAKGHVMSKFIFENDTVEIKNW